MTSYETPQSDDNGTTFGYIPNPFSGGDLVPLTTGNTRVLRYGTGKPYDLQDQLDHTSSVFYQRHADTVVRHTVEIFDQQLLKVALAAGAAAMTNLPPDVEVIKLRNEYDEMNRSFRLDSEGPQQGILLINPGQPHFDAYYDEFSDEVTFPEDYAEFVTLARSGQKQLFFQSMPQFEHIVLRAKIEADEQ